MIFLIYRWGLSECVRVLVPGLSRAGITNLWLPSTVFSDKLRCKKAGMKKIH